MDYTDVINQEVITRTIKACAISYEKQPENVKKDFYGACYSAFYKELNKQKQKNQEEQQVLENKIMGSLDNVPYSYNWLDEERSKTSPTKARRSF